MSSGGRSADSRRWLWPLVATLLMLLVSTIAPGWPFWAVAAVGIGAGFASISWNGVYLAEVARLAPPARVGDATAGSTFFVFIAYFVAPVVFSTAVSVVGSYAACFVTADLLVCLAIA